MGFEGPMVLAKARIPRPGTRTIEPVNPQTRSYHRSKPEAVNILRAAVGRQTPVMNEGHECDAHQVALDQLLAVLGPQDQNL